MRKLNELLRVFVTRVAKADGQYLQISRHIDGEWTLQTRYAAQEGDDLEAEAELLTESLCEQYPDPEELERAEYERLRLKFGGDPLPAPRPPGVWVGYEQCYDEITFRAAFETETEAQAWVIGRPGTFVEHVPYHEP
jgi:hypothetical protein